MAETSKKPNFLVIVADDLGFSDTQPYGSEIETPNLDWLAKEGLRMTDFHTAPTCSPTRSMLLSGTDNHIAGLGAMWEQMRGAPKFFQNKPGYEGYLNFDVAALPEVLLEAGYFTAMAGKWHLGMQKNVSPSARGFQKVFTYLAGAGNHYNNEPQLEEGIPRLPSLCGDGLWMEGDKMLDRKTEIPKDFYSTRSFTSSLTGYLTDRNSAEKEKPFFAYLPFTAPHWPLQAPRETIEKYKGKYDGGPDVLMMQRLEALKKLGLVSQDVEPSPISDMGTKKWPDMTPSEQARSSRAMEIFAAMVDEIDKAVGRVLDYLRSTAELDNTFIIFMSDNGAEGNILEATPVLGTAGSLATVIRKHYDNSLENMGNASSMVWYGPRWASASTAPCRSFKNHTSEGGIRCPCIVRFPPGTAGHPPGSISHTFTTVMDVMPTILELARVPHPAPVFQGRRVVTMRGKSWAPYLAGGQPTVYDAEFDFTGWELFGLRAVRKGSWKALFMGPPKGTGAWQLYNLARDPGEVHDRAAEEPDKLRELVDYYDVYFHETGVMDVEEVVERARQRRKDVLERQGLKHGEIVTHTE